MSTVIDNLERSQLRRAPRFDAGDRLRVYFQVTEGTRRRTQVFEGIVIKRQGHGVRETFTVRKQSFGVGVERTFPLHSPKIERIEVAARGDVRRAKLYYLRQRVGKRARVRERRTQGPEEVVERELLYGASEVTGASGVTSDSEPSPSGAQADRDAPESDPAASESDGHALEANAAAPEANAAAPEAHVSPPDTEAPPASNADASWDAGAE